MVGWSSFNVLPFSEVRWKKRKGGWIAGMCRRAGVVFSAKHVFQIYKLGTFGNVQKTGADTGINGIFGCGI